MFGRIRLVNGSSTLRPRDKYQINQPRNAMEKAILGMAVHSNPPLCIAPTQSSIGTTARSWAIRIPTVTRPVRVRSSPRSSSSFTATAVDDKATMKPSSTESGMDQPKNREHSNVTATDAKIWKATVKTASRHIRRKERSDSSRPTRNSSSSTPISAINSRAP